MREEGEKPVPVVLNEVFHIAFDCELVLFKNCDAETGFANAALLYYVVGWKSQSHSVFSSVHDSLCYVYKIWSFISYNPRSCHWRCFLRFVWYVCSCYLLTLYCILTHIAVQGVI